MPRPTARQDPFGRAYAGSSAGRPTLPCSVLVSLDAVPYLQPDTEGREGRVPGSIDYRLARRQLLRRVRSGEVAHNEVCDAQPELLRVGHNCSRKATAPCPVCGEQTLRLVQYVFAPRLPAGGRVVEDRASLRKLVERYGSKPQSRTYTVEVCLDCRWNHLIEVVPLSAALKRR